MVHTKKNIKGYPHLVSGHKILADSHYAIFRNGRPISSQETGVALTADPALWLCDWDRRVFDGRASFRVDRRGIKHYRGYSFVPCVHPATLIRFQQEGLPL